MRIRFENIQHYISPFYTALHLTVLYGTTTHSSIRHYISPFYTALQLTVLYSTTSHRSIWHYNSPFYTALQLTVLYGTTSHPSIPLPKSTHSFAVFLCLMISQNVFIHSFATQLSPLHSSAHQITHHLSSPYKIPYRVDPSLARNLLSAPV